MQGKATIAHHPIHPMLVTLPIGFFVGALVSYVIYFITADAFWPQMAVMLMVFGIAGALVAAVFGFIDYATAPMSSAVKSTATKHMALNLSVVVLFALAAWQGWADHANPVAIGLTALGVVVLAVAGWLGGKLAYVAGVGSAEASQVPMAQRPEPPLRRAG